VLYRLNNRVDAALDRGKRNQLKIIFLTSSYPRDTGDHASVFLRYLAEHLHARGAEVHVLAPADGSAGRRLENGVHVHRYRYFPRAWQMLAYGSGIMTNLRHRRVLWLQVPFFVLAMTFALFRLAHTIRPHIIHAHWILPQGLVALIAKFVYRVPVVTTTHGTDAFALRGPVLSRIKRFVLRHSDAWTTNTCATSRAVCPPEGLGSQHEIPMGVDIELFSSGDRDLLRYNIAVSDFIILFVGRLVEIKGIDDLLQAFSLLPQDLRQKSWLWIVGDGNERERLWNQARRLALLDRTKFFGRIPNAQLPDYYAAADLFVGPSIVTASGEAEGEGVVFLEAFAARLCVRHQHWRYQRNRGKWDYRATRRTTESTGACARHK